MKMPALQFYPADWRKDPSVQALGYFDRGVWFEILCLMHESSERGVLLLNGIPMPDEALANALGLDNQTLTNSLTKIITYGAAKRRESDGAIFSKRMVADEKLCQMRREYGKLGGNPNLVKQKSSTGDNQAATPSSSSSSSKKPPKPPRGQLADEKFDAFWLAYPKKVGKEAARKAWAKAKPNLESVLKALEWQKQSEQWCKDGGQYIPHPVTWLNQGRWDDAPLEAPETPSADPAKPKVHKCGVVGCDRDANANMSYGWRCSEHIGKSKP